MPSRRETFPVPCQGGLISNQPPIQLGINNPGAARRLVNFEPSIKGGYRRINGYQKWDANVVPSTGQIWGVCFFDGSVVAARGGSVYTSNGAGWTEIASSRTQTTKQRFSFFNFDGTRKMIGTDGVNYPYSWDGTTFTDINATTDVQGASVAVPFKNHMFYATDDLVSFSAPFDEVDFTPGNGAGSLRMPGAVTGMIVFRQQLFIFTEETISVLSGSSLSDFTLSSVAENTGCIAIDTIQEVAGDVAFLAADGVRLLGATDRNGDFSNQIASKAIQPELNTFAEEYQFFTAVTVREKSQYRLFGWFEGRSSSLTVGFISTQFEAQNPQSFNWAETFGLKVYSAHSQIYQGEEYVVFSSDTDYVYQMEKTSTFDGDPIVSKYWTPFFSFSDPMYRKTIYKCFIYTEPENNINGNLSVSFDFNSGSKIQPPTRPISSSGGGAVFGQAVFGSSFFVAAPEAIIKSNLVGSGQNCSLRFDFEGSSPFNLDTIMIEYATEDRN